MSVIYLLTEGVKAQLSAGRIIATKQQETLWSIPLRDVESLVVGRNSQVTTQALYAIIEQGGFIFYVDRNGKIYGTLGDEKISLQRLRNQMRYFENPEIQLMLSKYVVEKKIRDQKNLLRSYGKHVDATEVKEAVQSIGNAIAMFDYSSLFLTGHPLIRAGASNIKGQFTHYGSGINITSPSCKVSLKGGTIGTMASPPAVVNNFLGAYEFQQSGDFPIYDKNGKTLKAAKGYKFVDAKKNDVPITSSFDSFGPNAAYYLALSGASPDKRLTTTVTSSDGYYSIYIVKK